MPYHCSNGRWELGTDVHTVMVWSVPTIIQCLEWEDDYPIFRAWLLAVEDWVESNTQMEPSHLRPVAIWTDICISVSTELFQKLS